MSLPFHSGKGSEFDWEKLLRDDDERVNTYLSELPSFIDLPGEDMMIVEKIRRSGKPVPDSVRAGDFFMDFLDDSESDFPFAGETLKRDGTDVYLLAGKVARELAILFASETDDVRSGALSAVLCILGRIIARSNDLVELDDIEYRNLKIALAKRMMRDINTIAVMLEALGSTPEYRYAFAELMLMRDRVTDIISKLRHPPAEN